MTPPMTDAPRRLAWAHQVGSGECGWEAAPRTAAAHQPFIVLSRIAGKALSPPSGLVLHPT